MCKQCTGSRRWLVSCCCSLSDELSLEEYGSEPQAWLPQRQSVLRLPAVNLLRDCQAAP